MFVSLHGLTISSVAVVIALFSGRALACSCAEPPPPCEAVGQSELVFLGTVTELTRSLGTSRQPG